MTPPLDWESLAVGTSADWLTELNAILHDTQYESESFESSPRQEWTVSFKADVAALSGGTRYGSIGLHATRSDGTMTDTMPVRVELSYEPGARANPAILFFKTVAPGVEYAMSTTVQLDDEPALKSVGAFTVATLDSDSDGKCTVDVIGKTDSRLLIEAKLTLPSSASFFTSTVLLRCEGYRMPLIEIPIIARTGQLD